MRPRPIRNRYLRALAEPIERLVQINIALVLTQAVIVRLSIELANPDTDEPDTLMLLGFLGACVVAGVLVVFLSRTVRRFPRRALRIAIAIGTLLLQAAAFQLLHGYAS